MRISAIAPVGRRTSSPIDPVSWHDPSSRVRAMDANEASRCGIFQKVLEQVDEESHRARTRVLEVVFAPGVSPGYVRNKHHRR